MSECEIPSRRKADISDSSTRGLDASTALEYVRALRIATDLIKTSTIVSIYQAGESLWDIFDKVCLIYEGRMVYFGPTEPARQYFLDMGYRPTADRQTTPDFLVSVTDPNGRRIVDEKEKLEKGIKEPIPKTPMEFEEYYRKSEVYQMNVKDMEEYRAGSTGNHEIATGYRNSARQEQSKHTRWKVCPFCSLQTAGWLKPLCVV